MKSKLLNILIVSLFLCLFLFNSEKVNAYYKDSFGNFYFDYQSELDESYYSGLSLGLDSLEFREKLHKIISSNTEKHSYDDVYDLLEIIDESFFDEDSILCLFTRKDIKKSAHGSSGTNSWNREHVWAKSHGFYSASKSAPWNDLHHLRAAEAYTNSVFHNDRDYGYVMDEDIIREDIYGNKYSSTLFEPHDAIKGDIARMVLYMDIRYEGDSLSEGYELGLVDDLTYVTSVNDTIGYMGISSTIFEWAALDPVDDLERRRNDLVYHYQGNRNPFIDHPEYMNIIYELDNDLTNDDYRVRYFPLEGSFEYIDENKYSFGDLVTKPTLTPVSDRLGYEFEGWYTDITLQQKWDFDVNNIENDLNLYAKYIDVGIDPITEFKLNQTLTSLAFSYNSVELNEPEPLLETMVITPISGDGISGSKPKNTTINIDEYTNYNKNLFDISYNTNNKGSAYVGKDTIRLYAGSSMGTSLDITLNDESGFITSVTYVAKLGGTKDISPSDNILKVSFNGPSASIQNVVNSSSGNIAYIYSISVTYYTEVSLYDTSFYDSSLLYQTVLQKGLVDELFELDPNLEFGICKDNSYEELSLTQINQDEYILSSSVNVSLDELDKVYDVSFYVMINGDTYLMNGSSYSINELTKVYLNDYREDYQVIEYLPLLKALVK